MKKIASFLIGLLLIVVVVGVLSTALFDQETRGTRVRPRLQGSRVVPRPSYKKQESSSKKLTGVTVVESKAEGSEKASSVSGSTAGPAESHSKQGKLVGDVSPQASEAPKLVGLPGVKNRLVGRVIDVSGGPVAGAQVEIHSLNAQMSGLLDNMPQFAANMKFTDGSPSLKTVNTNEDGTFEFVGLSSSVAFRLEIRKKDKLDIIRSTPRLKSEETRDLGRLKMLEPAWIRGIVVDPSGRRQSGAKVTLSVDSKGFNGMTFDSGAEDFGTSKGEEAEKSESENGEKPKDRVETRGAVVVSRDNGGKMTMFQNKVTFTNAQGEFEFKQVETGTYKLIAASRNFRTAINPRVPVVETGTATDVTLTLRPTVSLRVLVVDESDNPIAGARIKSAAKQRPSSFNMVKISQEPESAATVVTDSRGEALLRNVRYSNVGVEAEATGFVVGEAFVDIDKHNSNDAVKIKLVPGGSLRVVIRDELTGLPVSDAHVNLFKLDAQTGPFSSKFYTGQTSVDGVVEFPAIAPGKFQLSATKMDYIQYAGNAEVKLGESETFDIKMKPNAAVEVLVLDDQNNPVEGARLISTASGFFNSGGAKSPPVTNAKGIAEITDIGTAQFYVKAEKTGLTTGFSDLVDMSEQRPGDPVTIRIRPGGSLTGIITDHEGRIKANAQVALYRMGWYGSTYSVTSNELGEFRFEDLAPGDYQFLSNMFDKATTPESRFPIKIQSGLESVQNLTLRKPDEEK